MRTAVVAFAGLLTALTVVAGASAVAEKGTFRATLSGAAEAPKKGDPDGSGTAVIRVTGSKLCWDLKVSRIGTPSAAHIHRAARGKAGPVVVPLGGAKFRAKGCGVSPAAGVITLIEQKPSAYYVNVHTAKYPAGAIRGQLTIGG